VPRISIVISAIGSDESLEATLVSVLENRPAQSEVFVALERPYADPYGLKGEVQFVEAARRHSMIDRVNEAIASARAPFVHLLASGCAVTEGWTEAALARFGDRRVASVAPLLLDVASPERIFAAGVGYRASGRRYHVGHGLQELPPGGQATIVGPAGIAAFYRKAALDLAGGLARKLDLFTADVDVALSLAAAGFTCAFEPQSQILATPEVSCNLAPFGRALREERLFWRNLPAGSRAGALLAHAGAIALETAASALRPRMIQQLAGRAWACLEIGGYVRRYALLRELAAGAQDGRGMQQPSRIDRSHEPALRSRATHSGTPAR
jgi:hypothetical protein